MTAAPLHRAASQASNTFTVSLLSQRRDVTFAAIAGVVRGILWMGTKSKYIREQRDRMRLYPEIA
jgi:hypothetical protein